MSGLASRIGVGALVVAGAIWFSTTAWAQGSATPTSPSPTPSASTGFGTYAGTTPTTPSTSTPPGGRGVVVKPPRVGAPPAPGTKPGAPPSATAPSIRGVQVMKNMTGVVGTQGTGSFNPIQEKPVKYPTLPDTGLPITYPGEAAAGADVQEVPVTQILNLVAESTGWNIVASDGVKDLKILFRVKDVKPREVMQMLQFDNVYYDFKAATNTLYVMTVDEYQTRTYGALEHEEFQIQHANVSDIEQVLRALLSKNGRLISDPRTGHILVWDTSANLDQMKKAVKQLDVPLTPLVIPLQHAQASDLVDSVQAMLSDRGTVQADPRGNTLIVTDLPSRLQDISSAVAALDRKVDTRTWTLNYVDPKMVAKRLETIFPEDAATVTVDSDSHQISVTAINDRLAMVDKMIKSWDVQPKQVQIEAYLVTADATITRNFGIDWSYFDNIQGSPFSIISGNGTQNLHIPPNNGQRFSIGSLPYQLPLLYPFTYKPVTDINGDVVPDPKFHGSHIAAVMDYLDQQGDIHILQKPRVTVQDGQQATFQKTTDVPFQNVGYSQYSSGLTNQPLIIPQQVDKITVGTIIQVKPRIGDDGSISMNISVEDSTASNVTIVAGNLTSTVPEKSENKAQTNVLVEDGQTIVIGGLGTNSAQKNITSKVPILGDIPLLGKLFRTNEKKHENLELLFFLTPTIVGGTTQPEAMRLAAADQTVAQAFSKASAPLMQRIHRYLQHNRNRIPVSIGESGGMFSEGKMVTMREVLHRLQTQKDPTHTTVVIRAHPGAPPELAKEIAQAASKLGMKVEFNKDSMPFVPAMPDEAPSALRPKTPPPPLTGDSLSPLPPLTDAGAATPVKPSVAQKASQGHTK